MRYPATEKLEIIRLVERSRLSVRRTLDKLGVSRPTFYRWYDLYRRFGEVGLEDRRAGPRRVWNRVPDAVRGQVLDLALEQPELSPRELAVTFTDTKAQFISEASVYRLLKAAGLAPSSSEANRLIDGGGVRIDSSVVSDKGLKLGAGTYVIQVGKRKFARVTLG